MKRRRHALQVSTFPFLAVLLCAMGSLILLLLVIDIATGPSDFWVQWVALIWGLILLVHFLNVFAFDALLGRDAEKRMLERELKRRRGE